MMKQIAILVFAVAFCTVRAEVEHAHEHAHEHEHEHEHAHEHEHDHGRSVEVSPAVQKVMGLTTVRAEKRQIAGLVSFTGRYELAPEARVSVATPVAGRLSLKVKSLASVKKGDVLATVQAPDLAARAREIAVLEKRLDVYRELKTPNAQLESDLAVKRNELESLLAGTEVADGVVTVRASTDGLVETLPSRDGAWVETGAELARLVRPHRLRLKALVAASDAARLVENAPCRVGAAAGTIRLGVGDDTGLVPVYVVFDAAPVKGRAGERAKADCVVDQTAAAVRAVPSDCIVRVGLTPCVFVKDEDDADRFLLVNVTPGLTGGGWTEVAGLPDDDDLEIVKAGVYELKLALPAAGGAKPAGHFHADGTFHEGDND